MLSPGCTVLPGSAKVATSIDLEVTPRAVAVPPLPGPQILPTPGQVPDELVPDVVADAMEPDGQAAIVAPTITIAKIETVSRLPGVFTFVPPSPTTVRALYSEPDRLDPDVVVTSGPRPYRRAL